MPNLPWSVQRVAPAGQKKTKNGPWVITIPAELPAADPAGINKHTINENRVVCCTVGCISANIHVKASINRLFYINTYIFSTICFSSILLRNGVGRLDKPTRRSLCQLLKMSPVWQLPGRPVKTASLALLSFTVLQQLQCSSVIFLSIIIITV